MFHSKTLYDIRKKKKSKHLQTTLVHFFQKKEEKINLNLIMSYCNMLQDAWHLV